MLLTKLKTAALVLPACLAFTGTGFLMHQALAEKPPQAQAKAEPKAANQGVSDAVTELTPAQFGKFHAILRVCLEMFCLENRCSGASQWPLCLLVHNQAA